MEKEEMVETRGLTEEQAKKTEVAETVAAPQPKETEKKEGKNRKEKAEKQTETAKPEPKKKPEKQAEIAKPEPQKKPEKPKATKDIPPFLESYVKAYPKETVFHVTSDKQVFLEKDLNLARFHQRSLKTEGEVQTIKVK